MTASPGDALTFRAAAALAGGGAARPAEDAGLRGSRILATLRPVAARVGAASRVVDPVAGALAAVPVPALLGALPALAVLRMSGAPVAAVLAVAGLALAAGLVRVARALHGEAAGRVAARIVVLGLLLRLALAAAVAARGGFPDERGYYHPLAEETAAAWSAGEPSRMAEYPVTARRQVYYAVLAGSYVLAGADPWTGRLLGIGFGLGAALLAGELARRLGGPRAAVAGLALLALHPEHALWSATLSRDALTTVLALAALLAVTGPPARPVPARLALAAAPAALLWWNSFLVAGAVAAVLVLVAGAAAVTAARERGLRAVPALAVAGALALLAAGWVGRDWGPWFSLEMISAVRNRGLDAEALSERALGFTTLLPGLVFRHPWELLAYLPLGGAWVLAAPLPAEAASGLRLAYCLAAYAGTAAAVAGAAGLARAARRGAPGAAVAVAFAATFLLLLAALEASSGVLLRHRLPLTAVLLAGAAPLVAGLAPAERAP